MPTSINHRISREGSASMALQPASQGVLRGRWRPIMAIAMLVCVALLAYTSGCITGNGGTGSQGSGAAGGGRASQQKAAIKVSGAWALYPMMVRWGEEYSKLHPNVRVDISAGGAGKGMTDAMTGMVDVGMVSRAIYPEEVAKGIAFVPVVKDAVIPTANSNNPLLKALYEKGARKEDFQGVWMTDEVTRWGQLTGMASTEKISVYTRSDACGAAETWAQYLGGKQEDLRGIQVYGDPGLADAVKRDVNGIGYNNLNYAYDVRTGKPIEGIVAIPIDVNGNGRLDPEEDFYGSMGELVKAIADGAYPSPPARDLYLVTNGSFKGAAADFVRWILTDGQKYVQEAGYINLPQVKIDEALGKLP